MASASNHGRTTKNTRAFIKCGLADAASGYDIHVDHAKDPELLGSIRRGVPAGWHVNCTENVAPNAGGKIH